MMKFCLATLSFGFLMGAHAQDWPAKQPIRYIVPFAPGGATDMLGRMVAVGLSSRLGQSVVVDNKAGQGGSVGSAELAKAKPDGYTIGGGTISSHALNVALYPKLSYDPQKDFAPITLLAALPNVLVVHPSLNVKSVAELVALLKANPNKYSFGSAGNGTSQHISGEMFKLATGTQIQHVPYRGSGPMMIDLLAGTIQLSFENSNTALPQAASGKLRALAVTSAKRSKAAPELLTMQEAGIAGYDLSSWQAFYAPAGTPPAIVNRLQTEVAEILKEPANAKKLADLGLEPGGGKPEELAALMAAEIPRLGNVVRQSGAKVD
ncbi:MAG: putative extracytoplasmic binding receptor [Pseudomonadota bacterium]|jgi:tripartite-type tricarboxylate transporter receptor subunit TctC